MEIDFSQAMKNLDGTEAMEGEGKGAKALTLGSVATEALLAVFQDEQALPGNDKVRRYELALRVHKGGKQDMKAEEIVEIKTLVGKAFAPIIVGQAWKMLEGK